MIARSANSNPRAPTKPLPQQNLVILWPRPIFLLLERQWSAQQTEEPPLLTRASGQERAYNALATSPPFQFKNKSPLDQKTSLRVDAISSRAWYGAGKIRFCISSWLEVSAPITSLNWSLNLQWVQGTAGHGSGLTHTSTTPTMVHHQEPEIPTAYQRTQCNKGNLYAEKR